MFRASRQRPHAVRIVTVATGFALVAGLTAPATADSAAPPSGQVVFDTDAHARFDWSLPSRWAGSWMSYDENTASYGDYVHPSTWSMNLDGCASSSVRRIKTYSFLVQQVGTSWSRTFTSSNCLVRVQDVLPAEGYYTVQLTLHTDWGDLDGVSAPAAGTAGVRDYLIVSLGDSLASGEGVPDSPGAYDIAIGKTWSILSFRERRAVRWEDRRCHRSRRSGPSQAAKAFEDADPKTSVTFVSLACSGATLPQVIDQRYEGQEPSGGVEMPAQLEAVKALFGPDSGHRRRIDALSVSAGVNDLDFADIVKRCATNSNVKLWAGKDCVLADGLQDKLDKMKEKYSRLASKVKQVAPDVREVYLNDYPAEVFHGGGCDLLGWPGVGITPAEGDEMALYGTRLNGIIRRATADFRGNSFRWNLVGPLSLLFGPHAYCADDTWFTPIEQSLAQQGNVDGTAHPNVTGHQGYAGLLRRATVLDQSASPYRRLRVTVTEVKSDVNPGTSQRADINLLRWQTDDTGETHALTVPRDGQWTPVPTSVGRFALDVYRTPSSPRHAVELRMGLGGILPIHHTLTDAYGAGTHEIANPNGHLSARYTVDVLTP